MTQPSNNITTLLIPDPNGGQPQMFKVMGGAKIPIQLTSSSVNTQTVKNFFKTNQGTSDQGATIIQAGKIQNRQIIAVPAKQSVNVQGIRGPVVVPVSHVQLKQSNRNDQLPGVVTGRATPTLISSPMVIRTQTGSLAVASSQGSSLQTPIQLPQIEVNKQVQQATTSASLLHAQLKQNNAGTSNLQSTFTLKTQPPQQQQAPKQSELIFVQQKQIPESLGLQPQQQQQPTIKQEPQIQLHQPQRQKSLPTQGLQKQSSQVNAVNSPKSLMNTSILDHSGSRKRHDFDFDYSIESKRRKTEKGGKGLRHFSMKVCEKVQAKGTTSYNEVADELVNEFSDSTRSSSPSEGVNYDQKNIRRRVYDALNVLMAMNIISKEKKEIRWLGLPTNTLQECHKLEQERKRRIQKIKLKTQQLQDLILQQIAFKSLVERNRRLEKEFGGPSPNSAIQLPFIIVNTSKKTVIDCSISNDKTEYLFNFDDTFEIYDDIEVLKRMGMALGLEKGICTPADLQKAKSLVPKALENYVVELSEGLSCEASSDTKALLLEETSSLGLDDVDSAIASLCGPGSEFSFEKMESVCTPQRPPSEGRGETMSRHSSLLSLSQDPQLESASPSSYGEDYDADNFDDSDIEIS